MSALSLSANGPAFGDLSANACLQQRRLWPDMVFEFVDPGVLRGDGFELFRLSITPPEQANSKNPCISIHISIHVYGGSR
jgi:hypothetical protein